ncbi:MAG TPA: Rieske 2Fe-2S domain-containing protein, partial [Acidobacteriaceae bacterium]|nr:Rieske 2Fe-2S domain-containing protein [Acidobacteriaceae bacterium]
MPEQNALALQELPVNTKKTITLGETKILLIRTEDTPGGSPTLFAVDAECPHAKAPLEKGAVCNGRLVCPWHTGTFELSTGALLEPPPLRDLQRYPVRLDGHNIVVDPTPIPSERLTPTGHDKHLVFAGGGAAA